MHFYRFTIVKRIIPIKLTEDVVFVKSNIALHCLSSNQQLHCCVKLTVPHDDDDDDVPNTVNKIQETQRI